MRLKARKSFGYKGRALTPGDRFTAKTRRDGLVLIAARRAVVDNGTYAAPTPKRSIKTDPLDHDRNGRRGGSTSAGPSPELQAARAEYKRVTGKRYFSGWDIEELQARQAKHVAESDPGDSEG